MTTIQTEGSTQKLSFPALFSLSPSTYTGVYRDISFKDYQEIQAINKSGLDQLSRSPAHYKLHQERESDSLKMGAAIHAAILEPKEFDKRYFTRPEGIDGRTKAGKERLQELLENNPGKIALKEEENETILEIKKAFNTHSISGDLLSRSETEVTAISFQKEFDLYCKSRIDIKLPGDTLIDLKTTEDAREENFKNSIKKYRYHVQAAFYLDVTNLALKENRYKRFAFIVIEKEKPYGIKIYDLAPVILDRGRLEYMADLKVYAQCLKENKWPSYKEEVRTIGL